MEEGEITLPRNPGLRFPDLFGLNPKITVYSYRNSTGELWVSPSPKFFFIHFILTVFPLDMRRVCVFYKQYDGNSSYFRNMHLLFFIG